MFDVVQSRTVEVWQVLVLSSLFPTVAMLYSVLASVPIFSSKYRTESVSFTTNVS